MKFNREITKQEAVLREVLSVDSLRCLQYRKMRDKLPDYDSVIKKMIIICKEYDLKNGLNKKVMNERIENKGELYG